MHLCARPLRVRLEIRMGLKGSSVPEMVIPRGPPCLLSSTVNMTEPEDSNSSTIYRHTQDQTSEIDRLRNSDVKMHNAFI